MRWMRRRDGWSIPDTIDPRQKDQTHTALLALNDEWKLGVGKEVQLSGFFRTYNLSLFSGFGLGLIRQSEFRTVGGASGVYVDKISNQLTLMAGTDYEREAPRRDDLDHYNFYNPATPSDYGAVREGRRRQCDDFAGDAVRGRARIARQPLQLLRWAGGATRFSSTTRI